MEASKIYHNDTNQNICIHTQRSMANRLQNSSYNASYTDIRRLCLSCHVMLSCRRRRRWRPCAARALCPLKPWCAVLGLLCPSMNYTGCPGTAVSDVPLLLPVTTKFSRLCLLNTCPRKASCRWRIRFSGVRCTPASWNTSSLLFFSVHDILSILRRNQTSTAINLSFIIFEIVQVSHPYNRTDQT